MVAHSKLLALCLKTKLAILISITNKSDKTHSVNLTFSLLTNSLKQSANLYNHCGNIGPCNYLCFHPDVSLLKVVVW